jgi:hypothetical protein
MLHGRGLITGFAAGLVLAGAGLAVADNSGPAESSHSISPSDSPTPFTGPESLGFVPEQEWRQSQGLPSPSEADEVDFAAEGPSPWLADTCRKEGPEALDSTPLHCEAIIAVAEGRLEPGAYSDEELRARLRD